MSGRRALGALFVVVCAAGAAYADFVAYNDCVWFAGQAIGTNVTSYGGGTTGGTADIGSSSGLLKNYSTGANTAVTATVSWNRISMLQGSGAEAAAGTDAAIFGPTTASLLGVAAYESGYTGWWVDVEFTGLDPTKQYEFVTTANRAGGSTYLNRYTLFTMFRADACTNTSSAGVTIGPDGSTSNVITGENTAAGAVARWVGINPGADGTIRIRSEDGGGAAKPYGIQAFRLSEVPEPATLILLALAPLAFRRR